MRLFSMIAALCAIMLALPADAHGPTRQKVVVKTAVAAPPAEVWAAIGNFQDMSWHPVVHATAGENGNAIDATRVLTLGEEGGPTIAEILYKFSDEKMSYSYRITAVEVEVLGDEGVVGAAHIEELSRRHLLQVGMVPRAVIRETVRLGENIRFTRA